MFTEKNESTMTENITTKSASTHAFNVGDGFMAECYEQQISSNRFGPCLQLKVKLTKKLADRYDPQGASSELSATHKAAQQQTVELSLNDATWIARAYRSLNAYGFDMKLPIEALHPENKKGFNLVGKTLAISCAKVWENDDSSRIIYNWYLNSPTSRVGKLSMDEFRKFAAANASLVEEAQRNATAEVPI